VGVQVSRVGVQKAGEATEGRPEPVDTASKIIQLDHDDLDAIRLVIRQNLFRTSLDLLHPLWAAPAFRFRDRIVRTRAILAGRGHLHRAPGRAANTAGYPLPLAGHINVPVPLGGPWRHRRAFRLDIRLTRNTGVEPILTV
jgi:hypothetical protein